MKIIESQLRQIIREELLQEAAMAPDSAKHMGIRFEVERSARRIVINAYMGRIPWKPAGSKVTGSKKVGSLLSVESDEPCSDAWAINHANVDINGLGPLLYDLMIDLVNPHPLMPDRSSVSLDAKPVWDYYMRRYDIEPIQLDDSCWQGSAMIWAKKEFGDADRWPESSLSKAYKRADGGTPTLDELQELGLVTFI